MNNRIFLLMTCVISLIFFTDCKSPHVEHRHDPALCKKNKKAIDDLQNPVHTLNEEKK